MNKIQSVVAVLAVFLSLALAYAANLTSCVGPSQVTCPPGASVHNVGSCPNGFVLWGCEYPNGTVVSSALPNSSVSSATTSILTTTPNTTTPSTTIASTLPSTTIPAKLVPSSNLTMYTLIAVVIIVIVAVVLYYLFASKKI